MKKHNIRHKYVKPGMVAFFVEIRGTTVILLEAKFNDFNDMPRLYKLAQAELAQLNSALHAIAA